MPKTPSVPPQVPIRVNGSGPTVHPPTAGDPSDRLPLRLTIDDADTPYDVVDALALAEFVSGRQPWARTRRLDRIKPGGRLVPRGARVLRTVVEDSRDAWLACGDGWTLRAVRWRSGGGEVTVTAVNSKIGRDVLKRATRDALPEDEPDDGSVSVGFWYAMRHGPVRNARSISAEPWADIRRNYTAPAADAFDRLMAVTADDINGRLLLLHGPPGTGKTTALRSLARSWREWCHMDCVLDPEVLFNDSGYLMDLVVGRGPGDEEAPGSKWRLLVLEDCDEMIRGEAKRSAGQALSRLLNLTDGLLGQGRNVLVAITTNENLGALHPAVVRPGRCLAQIEVGPLTQAEARDWLAHTPGDTPAKSPLGQSTTVAELYALRNGGVVEAEPAPAPSTGEGLYL